MSTITLKNRQPSTAKPATPAAPVTLEQKRAQFAWDFAKEGTALAGDEYRNLAKAAPALIMNNGLMQTLAYYQAKGLDDRGQPKKGQEHNIALSDTLQRWIGPRVFGKGSATQAPGFNAMMEDLLRAQPDQYRRATDEALLILRWIRQFAAAL